MIPISLRITGFLSYKDTAELDFSSFNLACISGSNGAGKSSILDAITWALFGQARKRDESLINSHPDVKLAEVVFTFQYEDQVYRVIRSIQKGKGTSLEFQIQAESEDEDEKIWRAISEHSIRETQNRIQETLRLDYETFVNAAFFLQGKADQFAQQQPGKRKEILGSILGLEQWEIYKEKAGDRRRKVERELDAIDGQMREISQELSEETQRKEALSKFEEQMVHLSSSRKKLETNLENMKNLITSIAHQRKLVNTLRDNLNKARITREEVVNRRDSRSDELIAKRSLLERADEIKNTYETWLDLQKKIADMNDLESNYKKLESKTLPLISRIETQKAKLDIELQSLKSKESEIFTMNQTLPDLNAEIQSARKSLLQLEKRIAEKDQWDQEIRSSRELQGALKSESENLTTISLEKKERISKLSETEGANCPLCGQPLTKADRIRLIDELQEEVSANRITYQNNQMKMKDVISRVEELEIHLSETRSLENDRLSISSKLAKLEEKLELINKSNQEWESQKSVYQDIQEKLNNESFMPDEREELELISSQMEEIGYDPQTHRELSEQVSEISNVQQEFTALSIAEGSIKPIEDEIRNLDKQLASMDKEIEEQDLTYKDAMKNLEDAERDKPDVEILQSELVDLQSQEIQLNREIGAAKQRVAVLDDQRNRKSKLEKARENAAKNIERLKTLERAFGKEGVPALLIEQALPEIEAKANEVLEKLSDGTMSLRFLTQAAYKDKKRSDLKETLDIEIMDGYGTRDYEMFSGGEAFRVNFAIRLALSNVLSHRKGARLQTLIIDEGFGSQDNLGRQRLIEAINSIKGDFAKILIITHLEALKDTFPSQIQVSKGDNGSQIQII